MKNTIENKQRFFDAYSGQKIFRYSWNEELYTNRYLDQDKLHKYTAELNSLSEISDDHLLWLGKNYNADLDYCKDLVRRYLSIPWLINYEVSDYLRSKGYLLPFMDLTIEKILEYGWAVLKSK